MAGTVNAKTNPATDQKNPFERPEEKPFFREEGTHTSQNGQDKSSAKNSSSKASSSKAHTNNSRTTKKTQTKRKSVKWDCHSCGTRNPKKNNTCKSCGGTLPTITLFKASRRVIKLGNPIRLTWEAHSSDKVLINPGNEWVENTGVLDVDPYETTEYTLTAMNEFGFRKLSTKVTLAPPKIEQFKASEREISIGFPTILHWKTVNAESLEINMDIGDVSSREFTEAYLTKPGTCTLVAKNRSGEVSTSIELFLKKPEILSFSADTQIIKVGKPNLLMWELHNTAVVEILPDVGIVKDSKVEVFPDRTTTYTLRAINDSGIVEKKLELKLLPPDIVYFAGDNQLSTEGAPVELSWEIENAYEVIIDQDIGPVEFIGKHVVKPEKAFTTYTLYAKGHSGEAVKSFQITRFPIPLDNNLVETGQEIDDKPDLRNNDLSMHLNEFDEMERQLRENLREAKDNIHIQRVQKMDLTEDLLALEKVKLGAEVVGMIKKLFKKFNKKSNT